MSALRFRNITASVDDPVQSWPFEGILTGPEVVFVKAEGTHREVHARNGNLFNEPRIFASGMPLQARVRSRLVAAVPRHPPGRPALGRPARLTVFGRLPKSMQSVPPTGTHR
jgi:hypothetical protein